ncbi:hypothetical protein [Prosthecobacter sp.]|uniref:hypothetical protein n=1 Tax=Prosthecobacter sp. TaxID=1965333 RepID=UPI003782DECC
MKLLLTLALASTSLLLSSCANGHCIFAKKKAGSSCCASGSASSGASCCSTGHSHGTATPAKKK